MKLTANEEYGLRCLRQLARHERSGACAPLGISEIAAAESMSKALTAKMMRILRQAGLVLSVRGARGGYLLSRPATEITLWQAMATLDGSTLPRTACSSDPSCAQRADCSLSAVWTGVGLLLRHVLERVSVADLLRPKAALGDLLQPTSAQARPSATQPETHP